MYVQNISHAKTYNPNFTSILPSLSVFYQYKDDNDYISTVRETQLTTGKRDDWNLKKLARIINHRFPKSQRVNIMPMNVSDGTEAYFIFKYLVEEVGGLNKFEKRFSHIAASDVCGKVLDKYPRQGRVDLSLKEAKELRIFGEPMFEQISDKPTQVRGNFVYYPYRLKEKFRKYFTFETCDFQKRLKNFHDEGNSVVFIRNCLRQSFGDTSAHIVYKVAKKLQGASLFVTGGYDRGMTVFEDALEIHFRELDKNVWGRQDYGIFDSAEKFLTNATKTLQNLKNRLKFK